MANNAMSNYDAESILQSPEYAQELAAQRTFMARVFGWMTIGLLITALVALVINFMDLQQAVFATRSTFGILLLVQFGIALVMSFAINKLPAMVAAAMFIIYSAITGLVFSILFLVFTEASIASTFFITAGMFGTMAFLGYTTKRDLTSIGALLLMALVGIIIASIVNMFMMSPGMSWAISFIGVIVFTGLTAYDTQKIKESYASGAYGTAAFERTAVFGAFVLYLDFINLFLYLLRFLGSRKN